MTHYLLTFRGSQHIIRSISITFTRLSMGSRLEAITVRDLTVFTGGSATFLQWRRWSGDVISCYCRMRGSHEPANGAHTQAQAAGHYNSHSGGLTSFSVQGRVTYYTSTSECVVCFYFDAPNPEYVRSSKVLQAHECMIQGQPHIPYGLLFLLI